MEKQSVKKLHLGCGANYKKGWINVDFEKTYKPDVLWNLDKFPYPFKANEFDMVYMEHTLEHMENPMKTIEEIWRICKPNAKVIISVPHYSHFTAHVIGHKSTFSTAGLQFFEYKPGKDYYSTSARFKIKKRLTVTRVYHKWANFLSPVLNMNHLLTELILCKFIPVSQIIFEMTVLKGEK